MIKSPSNVERYAITKVPELHDLLKTILEGQQATFVISTTPVANGMSTTQEEPLNPEMDVIDIRFDATSFRSRNDVLVWIAQGWINGDTKCEVTVDRLRRSGSIRFCPSAA
jgi:hypothetical protein